MAFESSTTLAEILLKVGMFALVQALVYFILSKSSNVFSNNPNRCHSFKPARSVSIRRLLAALADLPPAGELSPSPKLQPPSLHSDSVAQTPTSF